MHGQVNGKKWYLKKSVIIPSFLAVAAVLFIAIRAARPEIPEYSSATVERIDLEQTVSETGSVVADVDLEYGWETAGKVSRVHKRVGDFVKKGTLIAELENRKQRARLNEAYSLVAAAQAKLDVELAGPTSHAERKAKAAVDQQKAELDKVAAQSDKDIVDAHKALETAEANLRLAAGGEDSQLVTDAYDDLVNTIKAAVTTLSEAVIEADNILGIDNTFANDAYEDVLEQAPRDILVRADSGYRIFRDGANDLKNENVTIHIGSDHGAVDAFVADTQSVIDAAQDVWTDLEMILAAAKPIGGLTQTQIDTLRTDIVTQQAAVNKASTTVTDSVQQVGSARNSLLTYQIAYEKAAANVSAVEKQSAANVALAEAKLEQSQSSYDEVVADPRDVDLAALRAEVRRQQANAQALLDDLNKTKLLALADGIIAKFEVSVGENVLSTDAVITLNSKQLTVEVDISETDIAKIETRDPADITLDAFGEETVFTGSVVSIEPGETEISGVIYYTTKIVLDDFADHDVRSGMTANVRIKTDKREQALVIPERAIIEESGKKIVRVLTNAKLAEFENREVTAGLRGDNGQVEIVSGLEEGEVVVTFISE